MNQTDTLANAKASVAARVFALIVAIALAISSFSISSVAFAAEGTDEDAATAELVATQEGTPAAIEEIVSEESDSTIEDEENPLAAFDSIACKVHFWMFIGMALTAVYGVAIVLRRSKHAHDNNDFEKTILGKKDDKDMIYTPQGAQQLL